VIRTTTAFLRLWRLSRETCESAALALRRTANARPRGRWRRVDAICRAGKGYDEVRCERVARWKKVLTAVVEGSVLQQHHVSDREFL